MEFSIDRGSSTVTLKGPFTEASDFTPLAAQLSGAVKVDLAGVTRINSSGVRQWVNFLRSLPQTTQLTLEKCPVMFVNQMNMISNFIVGAQVQSVFVPYLCTGCEADRSDLYDLAAIREGRHLCPAKCDACGAAMELDAPEDEYFAFTRR